MRKPGFVLAAALLVTGIAWNAPSAVLAAENPYERGPDPTEQSVEAPRGTFDVAEETVRRTEVSGFGGGTIYHPTDTSEGTFGAVAVSPGYTGTQSGIAWLGPRLASQGFVVFTIDTQSTTDQPSSRAEQLLAALEYLTGESAVKDQIDAERLAVMGHSMGGGGSLEAAQENPELKAIVPLTPWDLRKDFGDVNTPAMIIGAQRDSVAPVSSHSEPFYESLPEDGDKAYLELRGASHFAPNRSNTTIAKYSLSWLKRFVDNDTRYDQFLCPVPDASTEISEYRGTCSS